MRGSRLAWSSGKWGLYMGNCQNYGSFLGPYYNTGPNTGPNLGDPKRDHNFDNPPYYVQGPRFGFRVPGLIRVQGLSCDITPVMEHRMQQKLEN